MKIFESLSPIFYTAENSNDEFCKVLINALNEIYILFTHPCL